MTRYTYPHVLDNGGGETLTFTRQVPGPLGDRLEGDNVVQPGAGPPMHVHYLQREVLTVVEGRMGWQRHGGPPQFAGVGEAAAFEPGDAHRFWNAGDTPLRCAGVIEPADNVEYFLTEIFASTRRNGGKRPGVFDAAYLTRRYRSEFAMLAIPAPVQRIVFPVIVAIGRLLGKYARYAAAPVPVRR